jgi:MerR family redox-sensitive transcriptional activator SoxR
MTIGELARRFGLRPSALRFYERRNLLEAPIRVGGRRNYDSAAVRRVGFIRNAQQSGLTLAEIKSLIRDGRSGISPRQLWRKTAVQKLTSIDRKIAALRASRAALEKTQACRCRNFTQCETQLGRILEKPLSRQPRGAK